MATSDERLVRALQAGLPRDRRPYRALAERLGVAEGELLASLGAMLADGRLRRLGAVVDQRRLGLRGNALVVWNVPDDRLDEVARALAARAEVSHAYERPRASGWPFNLYTMVHAADERRCAALVESWAAELRVPEHRSLPTVREWKKSAPVYFP